MFPMICSSTDSVVRGIALWPISSVTKIAVSWSIESLMVAITPSDISDFTTSPPLRDISFASSPTKIVSGISTSFLINSEGLEN